MKALLNGKVIAKSNDTIVVEGNHYFPPESLQKEYFKDSETQYTCPWKGEARYYHLLVDGKELEDGAWEYPNPKEAAQKIAGHIAFDPEVKITEE